jgi:peptide-methionine (S)-S-oxide reductase
VQVTFDPRQISYGKILQIYFSVAHNPTELNRQGPDSGTQYRSELLPQSEAQLKTARGYMEQLDKADVFKQPIVTKTGTMKAAFFPAEGYHQDYAINHPYQPYIVYNDAPKVENLKKLFPDLWREQPVTVAQADKGH